MSTKDSKNTKSYKISKNAWVTETTNEKGRSVSIHLLEQGKHVWLWVGLILGAHPKSTFPQFQRPLPLLDGQEVHQSAVLPETTEHEDDSTFQINGNVVKARFKEFDKELIAELSSSAPVFRWE